MNEVYITAVSKFLPNEPITNDRMEEKLGYINGKPSKAKSIVLRNNKITTRYYAIAEDGTPSHSNAELAFEAIKNLINSGAVKEEDIELLSCGSSTPDQLLPSHASMIHGMFKHNVEINSAAGICTSGMNALKFGYLSVLSGNTENAVCVGSEKLSSWMKAEKFNPEIENLTPLEENPIIAFEKDFLRWMLSDGAGAVLLENKPNGKTPLKIKWIHAISYANELETCMYAGALKNEDGTLKPWSDMDPKIWLDESVFSLKQDIKILNSNVIQKGALSVKKAFEKHSFNKEEITYFLPHISSFYFKDKLYEELANLGLEIPEDKWFINLNKVGNVGAASSYLQLEELVNSGTLKKGDKIILAVPESGRFSYVNALLEVC
ncbi:beta-ketoacyl-ACP synthase III [Apibacter sp. HY039]|uniref:beta-ketoacyl-ACP synthase III n=1 Tax=Apibacter sp. HY039 TaxID=2501476 RepID=UPI000FEBFDBC|nr:beta-ketoacyl-ACP synthase III [Apibacter sp. HY039]